MLLSYQNPLRLSDTPFIPGVLLHPGSYLKGDGMKKQKCKTCKQEKLLSEFDKRTNSKIGYKKQCKDCKREQAKSVACSITVTEKKCSTCKKTKDVSEFTLDKSRKDGYLGRCKNCIGEMKKKPLQRFNRAKVQAKLRNINFNIKKRDYIELIKNDCYYCGKKTFNVEAGCGLDRIDNNKEYAFDNVLPSCGNCNKFRGDNVTAIEFKVMTDSLIAYRKNKLEEMKGHPSYDVEVIEKKKKVRKKTKEDPKRLKKALQLSRRWAKMKKEFYKQKTLRLPSQNGKDFKHFLLAVDIINSNGTTIKKFLKAQIEGLKFINEGNGAFPKPNHLSTSGAETRLLDYIRIKELENVELTDEEKRKPLQQNKLYKKRYDKVKSKTATLLEALYVQECQYVRKDAAQTFVIDYIESLRKE